MTVPAIHSAVQHVGFIGLGDQGGPMAIAIAEAGFTLHVWARRPSSLEILAGIPHLAHANPAELVGASDILCLCLNDDQDVWEVLNHPGMIEALEADSIVVNHGTGDPDENRRIASTLGEVGIAYLDAPVSGGRPAAMARTLTTIVGGDEQSFRRCEPVFAAFSGKCAFMGRSGNGQMTKLLNNALTMTNLKNVVDVFTLAHRLDIDLTVFYDVIRASSGSSRILEALPQITESLAFHLHGLMKKDIEHFADGVRSNGQDPTGLRDRGLAGAMGLSDVVGLLSRARDASSKSRAGAAHG